MWRKEKRIPAGKTESSSQYSPNESHELNCEDSRRAIKIRATLLYVDTIQLRTILSFPSLSSLSFWISPSFLSSLSSSLFAAALLFLLLRATLFTSTPREAFSFSTLSPLTTSSIRAPIKPLPRFVLLRSKSFRILSSMSSFSFSSSSFSSLEDEDDDDVEAPPPPARLLFSFVSSSWSSLRVRFFVPGVFICCCCFCLPLLHVEGVFITASSFSFARYKPFASRYLFACAQFASVDARNRLLISNLIFEFALFCKLLLLRMMLFHHHRFHHLLPFVV